MRFLNRFRNEGVPVRRSVSAKASARGLVALQLLLLAALPLMLAGCGKTGVPAARLTPLAEDAVILIYAAGISDEAEFLRSALADEAVGKALKRTIVNRGQNGELCARALERLPEVLEECDPDLLVLGYGATDLWKKTDRAQLKSALCAMIDLAHKQKVQVVMLALPDFNRLSNKPDPIFEEVALEKNVPIETEIIRSVLSDLSTKNFRYMVNDKGLAKIGEAVHALCVKSGALPN